MGGETDGGGGGGKGGGGGGKGGGGGGGGGGGYDPGLGSSSYSYDPGYSSSPGAGSSYDSGGSGGFDWAANSGPLLPESYSPPVEWGGSGGGSSGGGGFDTGGGSGGFDWGANSGPLLPPTYATPQEWGGAPVAQSGQGVTDFITSNQAVGPAGTSGGADLSALASANVPGSQPTGPTFGAAPAGVSAGGDTLGVGAGSGGSSDLTRKSSGTGGSDSNWMTTFGIKNPAETALAAVGMGLNMAQGQKTSPAQTGLDMNALRAAGIGERLDPNAQTLMDRGTGLTGYIGTGTLPPEMQAQIDQSKADATQALISKYAARGMPTDPTKNSSLRAELDDLDRRSITMASEMAAQLAGAGTGLVTTGKSLVDTGLQATGLSSTAYNNLISADTAQSDRTQKAIAAMAAALSGRTGTK